MMRFYDDEMRKDEMRRGDGIGICWDHLEDPEDPHDPDEPQDLASPAQHDSVLCQDVAKW